MLAYIDESGYPTPGDLSPWNTLVAVCTPESASRDMSRWLHAAVRASFPATDPQVYEVKAATLLNRRQYEHSAERRRLVADVTSLMERLPLSVFGVRARRAGEPTGLAASTRRPASQVADRANRVAHAACART